MEETKKCSKCGEVKALTEFSNNKARCKPCRVALTKAYREANLEKVKADQKAWREANPEKVKAAQKAWREANPEKVKAGQKAWREVNKKKINASAKARRIANPEGERAECRRYYYRHLEARLAYAKQRTEDLSAGYVAALLRMRRANCPPKLIELKRAQLMLHRDLKRFSSVLKEKEDGNK